MDVILLGTGSPIPSPTRAGPATLVKAGGTNLLVDCGRGVVMRLMSAGAPPATISAVLLTHMHSDHITDFNDIITTHWVMSVGPTPLKVYGPVGVAKLVEATLAMLAFDVKYRIDHHADLNDAPRVEVVELSPGDSFTVGDFRISAHRTDHSPVFPTLGYRIEQGGVVAALAGDTIPCAELDENPRVQADPAHDFERDAVFVVLRIVFLPGTHERVGAGRALFHPVALDRHVEAAVHGRAAPEAGQGIERPLGLRLLDPCEEAAEHGLAFDRVSRR